jgi:hypothetical protein
MNYTKRFLLGTGGLMAAALVLTMIAPKAVHAIAATLVQVTNTTANPVPIRDTHTPYGASYTGGPSGNCQGIGAPGAPAGETLVVETFSAVVAGFHGVTPQVQLNVFGYPGGNDPVYFIPLTLIKSDPNLDQFNVAIPFKVNIPPGGSMLVSVCPTGNQSLAITNLTYSIGGYTVAN